MVNSYKTLINSGAILYHKIISVMNATVLLISPEPVEINLSTGYTIGAIIAILLLGYLFYSLIKPEKF
jgi:K+-transporting ATPase KdpF subunit